MDPETLCHSGPERRAEPRIDCSNPAELAIMNSAITSTAAVIKDVSRAGLRVIANTRMSPGQQVRIKMGKLIILGEVQKKLLAPSLTFHQKVEVHLRDLLQEFLHLGVRAADSRSTSAFISLGMGIWRTLSIAETDGENPDRSVAFALALLAKNGNPGLLQRTIRLNKEPGKMAEGSGIF